MKKIKWLDAPEEHDFPAAREFLSLIYDDAEAAVAEAELRAAETIQRKAKDILRASALPLLDHDNHHVMRNLGKIHEGTSLSPILLVRSGDGRVLVADGYHRLCAVYHYGEDNPIPVRLV